MPKIGAHVSAAVELGLTVERAKGIGANCFQFFLSPPQQWLQTPHDDSEIEDFAAKVKQQAMGPTFIHGTYLINLGTDKKEHLEKSIAWLQYALNLAQDLSITGVIFHTGSHGGRGFETVIDQTVDSLNVVLNTPVIPSPPASLSLQRGEPKARRRNLDSAKTKIATSSLTARPRNDINLPYLILENSAGAGGNIGSNFSELGRILKQVQNDRLKICLDTCHAFASGYDVKTSDGIKKTLEEFDQEIGLNNLAVIHANDTKFDIGSKKDRHENIGEGFIGKEGFSNLINNPLLKDIPFILEVPGFSGSGPDRENIDILKSLMS